MTVETERGMAAACAWGRRRLGVLALAALACLGLGGLYMAAHLDIIGAQELAAYPFGSDVPTYIYGGGMPDMHWLMTQVLRIYRKALAIFGIAESAAWIKAPYALFGMLNAAVAIAVFAIATGRLGVRSVIHGACVGLALSVWYFSSVPESYALSTLLYSAYVLGLVHVAAHGLSRAAGALMALVLLLALYNDVSVVLLMIAPAIMFGLRLWKEQAGRLFVYMHAGAVALYLADNILTKGFLRKYFNFFMAYAPVTHAAQPEQRGYEFDFVAALMNFFFYSMGAPRAELTHAPWLEFPNYHGFFDPSPLSYLSGAASALFLALYLALFAFIRLSLLNRLVLGLAAFVLLRFAVVVAFNPVEAILYASVAVLPLLFVLFHFVEKSAFRFKTAFAAAFALSMLAANARFFF